MANEQKKPWKPGKADLKLLGRSVVFKYTNEQNQPTSLTFTSAEKEKRDEIKHLVEAYNKLPSKTKLEKIIKLMTPKTTAATEAKLIEKKVSKRSVAVIEKEVKELSNPELEKALEAVNTLMAANKELVENNKVLTDEVAKLKEGMKATKVVDNTNTASTTVVARRGEH